MRARFLALGLVVAVSGCGFEPMYGTARFNTPTAESAALEQQLQSIEINNIPDREGQMLRNTLIDRFYVQGRPQNPAYHLNIAKINESSADLDITKESDATRAQLKLDTVMELKDAQGQVVLSREITAVGSYNILTSEFATRISEDNTRKNLINDLAARIERQVGLYFQGSGQ